MALVYPEAPDHTVALVSPVRSIAAVAAGGSPANIARAADAIAEGAVLAEAGRPNEAINAYKRAWEAANKA